MPDHNRARAATILIAAALLSAALATAVLAVSVAKPAGIEMPTKLPTLEGPVAVTSIGQAPGASWVRLLLAQLKLPVEHDDELTASRLANLMKDPKRAPKVLIMAMGTSGKGMGGAGVDINSEVVRCNALVAEAKKHGIFIIGGQIEGMARRTDEGDERSNKAVAPQSNMLIVMKDVDYDGYFTNVAKQKGIPLVRIVNSMDFKYPLAVMFDK